MIWVGTGLMPANTSTSTRNDLNFVDSLTGAPAQSPADLGPGAGPLPARCQPAAGPMPDDPETARRYGARIATITQQFKGKT